MACATPNTSQSTSAEKKKKPAPSTLAASAETPQTDPNEMVLFDGTSLAGWIKSDFAGSGEVTVKDGKVILGTGFMTGITWTNAKVLPKMNYEVSLEAMRVEGSDFFSTITFPVGQSPCSLVVGGWGGGVVGLSSLDGEDAANNETAQFMNFENGRWYKIRLRVMPEKIQAWINDELIVNANTKDRQIGIRFEVEPSLPFGISTWSTTGAVRNIRIRRL